MLFIKSEFYPTKPFHIHLKYFILLNFLFESFTVNAQKVSVDAAEDGEKIKIRYSIDGIQENDMYDVSIFYSTNAGEEFIRIPLNTMEGDVGENIKGIDIKNIIWDVLNMEDTDEFKFDNLIFKVQIKMNKVDENVKKIEMTDDYLDLPWPEMVLIEGGLFNMGSNDKNRSDAERPIHSVILDDFFIGVYEVTQLQWKEIMEENPSKFNDCENCPVEQVSWYDVQNFIEKLNQKTGLKYRLPTEAEWEYAARGGKLSQGYKYAGTDTLKEVARFYRHESIGNSDPVGYNSKENELGLFNMTGNVAEWCSDWAASDYYYNSPKKNPKGPENGITKIVRGGSWLLLPGPGNLVVTGRDSQNPSIKDFMIGFRLARSKT